MANTDLTTIVPQRLVSEWARIAIERLQAALEKKKIGVTRELFNSFKRELENAGGDVGAVIIKFLMYGRFVDMGVGQGVKAYERKTNRANLVGARAYGADVSYNRRQPKRWYSKTKAHETLRLQELLIEDLGERIPAWIAEQWSENE